MQTWKSKLYEHSEYLMKKYKARLDCVEADRRSRGSSFSDDEKVRLGTLLESVNQAYNCKTLGHPIYEAVDPTLGNRISGTQTHTMYGSGNVNTMNLKRQAFDVITGVYPNIIADRLVSVQPLQQKQGQIFFLKYVRGSNRGRYKRGETLMGQFETAGYEGRNYSGEVIEDESHEEVTGADYKTSIENVPIIPGTVTIHLGDAIVEDSSDGVLGGLKANGASGTIDYATGEVILKNVNAGGSKDVTISYEQDLEYAPAQIPELNIQISDTFITAKPRKLRSLFSMDAAYDIQMAQGIDIAESLLVAAANELKHQTDGDIISSIWNGTKAVSSFNGFYNSVGANISQSEWAQSFVNEIHIQCNAIYNRTKRVRGNWVVCGKKAQDLLNMVGAPRFAGTGSTGAGPYYAGKLDGQIDVFFDPFLGENDYLIGYKGDTLIDTGFIFAPYLMFYNTELVMMDDFLGRRGYATSYGKRMIEPNLYVRGSIVVENKANI